MRGAATDELAKAAKAGDERALAQLITALAPVGRYWLTRYRIRDEAAFWSAFNERVWKLVKIWEPERRSIRSFMAVIARRVLISQQIYERQRSRALFLGSLSLTPRVDGRRDYGVPDDGPQPIDALLDGEDDAEAAERTREILAVLRRKLSPLELASILGVASGRSYADVGEREGVNAKAIDNAIGRARVKLRKTHLADLYAEVLRRPKRQTTTAPKRVRRAKRGKAAESP